MADKPPAPNDQRSNVKNSNNDAFKADQANREKQASEAPKPQPKQS